MRVCNCTGYLNNDGRCCMDGGFAPNPMDYEPFTPYVEPFPILPDVGNYGWICPKCDKVFSPDVDECCSCNNKEWSTTTTTSNITINNCCGKEKVD